MVGRWCDGVRGGCFGGRGSRRKKVLGIVALLPYKAYKVEMLAVRTL
jgi:hypothetical protein